jgi:hypothetical protein
MAESKHAFVPPEDRPEVKIDPDMPISQLRVRDLAAIFGGVIRPKAHTDHLAMMSPQMMHKVKEHIKVEKLEKLEHKEKFEKLEKIEQWKEKIEKAEHLKQEFDFIPQSIPQGDPATLEGVAQLAQLVAGLTSRVEKLADQIGELQKRGGK